MIPASIQLTRSGSRARKSRASTGRSQKIQPTAHTLWTAPSRIQGRRTRGRWRQTPGATTAAPSVETAIRIAASVLRDVISE